MMHAILSGVNRDQMMAKHKANHIQIAYANSSAEASICAELLKRIYLERSISPHSTYEVLVHGRRPGLKRSPGLAIRNWDSIKASAL